VANQLGNSVVTLVRDHARVWEDFDPSERVDAETHISRARRAQRRRGGAQRATRQ
jgi:hypothetical protein